MREELELIEKIEHYLLGNMTAQDKVEFESQMNGDTLLKRNVEIQKQIMNTIQLIGVKNAAQQAYKSWKVNAIITKVLFIVLLVGGALASYFVFGSENSGPFERDEVTQFIEYPENDSLSSNANQYLNQELFNINTNHDTIIETTDGIVVYIPTNAFDTESDNVDFVVQGAINPDDVMNAGLSTITEDGEALETGGMFYLDAFVDGDRVGLLKELNVDVPTSQKKEGMQLYDGVKNADSEIVWQEPKALENFLTSMEITELDFYPPNYENSLKSWGYAGKEFFDSLYYSFAWEEDIIEVNNCWCGEAPERKLTPEESKYIYGDDRPINNLMIDDEAAILAMTGLDLDDIPYKFCISEGEKLFNANCASCHFPDRDMTGPALQGTFAQWSLYSSPNNYYNFIKNSQAVIHEGDPYAKEIAKSWGSVMTPQPLDNWQINSILQYIMVYNTDFDYLNDALLGGSESPDTTSYPLWRAEYGSDTTYVSYDEVAEAASSSRKPSCGGINPANIKAIWNSTFNGTNISTREFEERIYWIHKSKNNDVLALYIDNLSLPLSKIDSMVIPLVSGEVKNHFEIFASRGEGRVELNNDVANKLSAYYENKRKLYAEALVKTQKKYWENQNQLDSKNRTEQSRSNNRAESNRTEVFNKEFEKNLNKVYCDLGISCDDPPPPAPPATYSVAVNNLGWKNIDRKVREITLDRDSKTISYEGETSTLSYKDWSATIRDFEKFDRINVYNIPVEFDSYVKIKGENGKYTYKLNADISYQTVVLAWTEDGVFYYKAKATPGNENIKLRQVSDYEWKNEIRSSLSTLNNMREELNFVEYSQKDQIRINSNIKKHQLRKKTEEVIFPCTDNENMDNTFDIGHDGHIFPQ